MRYAIPTFFLILGLLVFLSWFNNTQQATPDKEALSFLADIRLGDLSKIVRHFGSNVCQCPKKKGWGAYLNYQTDEEPNLAFLLGHPFKIGAMTLKRVDSPPQSKHGVIWEQPEDYLVNVRLDFSRNEYSPMFLPLPLAYGKEMTWKEVAQFIENPSIDWAKSFTLRLRSSLNKGAIDLDTSTIEPDVRGEFKFIKLADKHTKETSSYFAPKDPGLVIADDGQSVNIGELSNVLPRLNAATIQMRVVRSVKIQPWTVSQFEILLPVLQLSKNDKLINLAQQN